MKTVTRSWYMYIKRQSLKGHGHLLYVGKLHERQGCNLLSLINDVYASFDSLTQHACVKRPIYSLDSKVMKLWCPGIGCNHNRSLNLDKFQKVRKQRYIFISPKIRATFFSIKGIFFALNEVVINIYQVSADQIRLL